MKKKFFYFFCIYLFICVTAPAQNINNLILDLTQAIEKENDPERLAALYSNRAIAYAYIKLYGPALDDLNKAMEYKPILYETEMAWAYISHLFKDYSTCIDVLNRLISINDSIPQLHVLRGASFFMLKDYSSAVDDFSLAISKSPSPEFTYYNNRGVSYLMLYFSLLSNDKNRADRCLQNAYNDFATSIKMENRLASSYQSAEYAAYLLGKYDEAIHYATQELKITQDTSLSPYYIIGVSYFKLKKYDLAQENLDKCLNKFGTQFYMTGAYETAKSLQFLIYIKTHKFIDAERTINELILKNIEKTDLYLARAYLYLNMYNSAAPKNEKEKYLTLFVQDLFKYKELGEEIEIEALVKNKDTVIDAIEELEKTVLEKMIDEVFKKRAQAISLDPQSEEVYKLDN